MIPDRFASILVTLGLFLIGTAAAADPWSRYRSMPGTAPAGDITAKGGAFTISGRVTGEEGGPLAGVLVRALPANDPEGLPAAQSFTDASGSYVLSGLPAGSFFVGVEPFDLEDETLLGEFFPDVPCLSALFAFFDCGLDQATEITVGPNVTGIDVQLDHRGGFIAGAGFDADGNPLTDFGVLITADSDLERSLAGLVDRDGTYRSLLLLPGTYFLVAFRATQAAFESVVYEGIFCDAACFDDQQIPSGATPVTVVEGVTTTNVDFTFGVLRDARSLIDPGVPLDDDSEFGADVAVCGSQMFVGVPGALNSENEPTGVVQIYRREGDDFVFTGQVLEPTGGEAGDRFGETLACDGDLLVVGAPAPALAKGFGGSGSAYIFKQGANAAWQPLQALVAQNLQGDLADMQGFGSSVDIQGMEMIVGAPGTAGGGAAAVFRFDDAASQQFQPEARLDDRDGENGDDFGSAVAISEGRAVVGAPSQGGAGGLATGVAQLFDAASGERGWSRIGKFTNEGAADGDGFGSSVDLQGRMMVVGAPGRAAGSGAAYTFGFSGAGATRAPMATLDAGASGNPGGFGADLQLEASRVVVGAPGAAAASGAAYLFGVVGNSAQRLGRIEGTGENGDRFGRSVAISGNALAFGAPGFDGAGANRGAAATLPIGDTLFESSFER